MKEKSILMIGVGLDVKGGVATVEKLMLANTPPEIKYTFIGTLCSSGGKFRKSAYFIKKLGKVLESLSKSPNIVHIHFSQKGSFFRKLIVIYLCNIFKASVVIHAHGSEFDKFFNKLPRPIKFIAQRTFGKSRVLICLSEKWAEFYREAFNMPPENVRVIYNPVGIPQIDNKESSHMVKLIGLGRIGKRKGVYDLIDAVALIKQEVRKSIKIVWHGDGEIREANEYALSRGVEHHFDFKSWIGDTEKKNLLKSADIFVLPSYDEGLPMALLEAMSYSIPVITTNVGGIPEVISSGTEGILLTPGDIISLKVAIEDLAKNRDLRQSMGENGRRASEQLDITSYMLRIRNIYSEITI